MIKYAADFDLKNLAKNAQECFLNQLLDVGFFHCNPHPGNFIRMKDGKLAILDYGLMA